jgi:hypothetical protein
VIQLLTPGGDERRAIRVSERFSTLTASERSRAVVARQPGSEEASMFDIGPIVGKVTQSTALVWVRRPPDEASSLRPIYLRLWAADTRLDTADAEQLLQYGEGTATARGYLYIDSGESPIADSPAVRSTGLIPVPGADTSFGAQIAVLEGLEPDRRYFYDFAYEEDAARPTTAASFRTLPEDTRGVRIAYASCNDQTQTDDPRGRSAKFVERFARVALLDSSVRIVFFGGDQIYADDVARGHKQHPGDDAGAKRGYGNLYLRQWNRPALRDVMAHLSTLMMWDDHDIYDGYGSIGDEGRPNEVSRLFGIAAAAFDAHQLGLAGFTARLATPYGSPAGTFHPSQHRAFGVDYGAFGILALDLRTSRRVFADVAHHVVGEAQWRDVEAWLDAFGSAHPAGVLYVMSSVPLVFTGAIPMLPGPLGDAVPADLRDQWSFGPNVQDKNRVIRKLLSLAEDRELRIVVVGGDVHCGGFGQVERTGGGAGVFGHVFSSPLTHDPGPLGSTVENLLRDWLHVADGSKTSRQRIEPIDLPSGSLLLRERNFVLLGHQGGGCWAEFCAESQANLAPRRVI